MSLEIRLLLKGAGAPKAALRTFGSEAFAEASSNSISEGGEF